MNSRSEGTPTLERLILRKVCEGALQAYRAGGEDGPGGEAMEQAVEGAKRIAALGAKPGFVDFQDGWPCFQWSGNWEGRCLYLRYTEGVWSWRADGGGKDYAEGTAGDEWSGTLEEEVKTATNFGD